MTVVLFNLWAGTFIVLGLLYCLEGWRDDDHWLPHQLWEVSLIAMTPILAQYMLLNSLWKYGKYYTLRVYHHLFTRP